MQRVLFLYIMISLYVIAGINHFLNPEFYNKIIPPWLKWHLTLIYISGCCEILFGVILIFSRTRVFGAWCIVFLLIAIFPANIQMLINYIHQNHPQLWLAIIRLPIQVFLIWWAYIYTNPYYFKFWF